MSVTSLPDFYTLKELAQRAGSISERTFRREIQRGNLVATRVGKCLRVTPEDYEEWRQSRAQRPERVAS